MISYGGGDKEGLCFDHGVLGDMARLLQCLHHAYLEVFVQTKRTLYKRAARPVVVRNNFGRVLNIIRIKIRSLKGENKWNSSGNSIQTDWKFDGSKQRISCSKTEYSIFLKEKAYPNVGNR